MIEDTSLFVDLAQIAGVFVGFGALISFTRGDEIDILELGFVRAVVSIGLVVIVAALIPVGLVRYGVTGHTLWLTSSIAFLALIWFTIVMSLRTADSREQMIAQARANPVAAAFFATFLEIPIQVPLILVVLNRFPDLHPAFYTTALVINLIEAAFVLAQVVFHQANPPAA